MQKNSKTKQTKPPMQRRAYSINETVEITGLSRPTVYRRIADKTFRIVRIGKKPAIINLNDVLAGR